VAAPSAGVTKAPRSVTQKAASTRANATHGAKNNAAPKTQKAASTHAAPAQAGEKPWYEQSQKGLDSLVEKSVNSAVKGEETPYQQRLGEIAGPGGIAQTAENRLAGFGQQSQTAIGALRSTGEASAKTNENEAAEQAKAALAQETTPAGATQGELAEQNAQRGVTSSLANARVGTEDKLGANESEYLTKLQAIASQRATEGGANLAGKYATLEGQQTAKLAALKAEKPGEISSEELKLLPEATKAQLAASTYGLKAQTLAVTANKDEKVNERAKEGHGVTEADAKEKDEIAKQNDTEKNKIAGERTELTAKEVQQKQEVATADIREKEAKIGEILAKSKSGLTTSEQDKIKNELSRAIHYMKQGISEKLNPNEIRNNLTKGKEEYKTEGKTVKGSMGGPVSNQVIITAAQEIAQHGHVSSATKQQLILLGIPANEINLSALAG
jgi:hypothetical protein